MATFDQRKFQFFREREERSILIKIRLKLHEISTEVLLEVFSTCGYIETVEIFRSGEEFHSKVCFEDQDSTMRALDWYNGWCIYGSCCQLELIQASQVIDRSSKIKVPTPEVEDALEIPAMPEIGERHSRMEKIPIKGDDIQIAQDSSRNFDQKFEEVSEIVLGDSKAELHEVQEFSVENGGEMVVDLARAEGITNLPNNRSQEIVDNLGEQEVSYLRQGPGENLAKQGTECKTSKVTSDSSFAVENALDRKLESGMEEVAKDEENGIGNLICSSQILKKMTDIGMISVGFLKIPVEYQVFGDLSDQGSAITKKIDNTLESFAVAYNVFDKMPWEDMVARSMKYNWYLVVFDPGGWQKVNSIGMEKMMLGVGMKLSEYVGNSSRFEPFDPCSVGISYGVSVLEASSGVGLVFDPGIVNDVVYSFKFIKEGIPFDRGESTTTHANTQWVLASMGTSFPYDRGRCNIVQVADFLEQLPSGNFVFDPGGTLNWEATAG